MSDVIGNEYKEYFYDDQGNLIKRIDRRYLEGNIVSEDIKTFNHKYENGLLVETKSDNSTITYQYDEQDRLHKSIDLADFGGTTYKTTKTYFYENVLNATDEKVKVLSVSPNPATDQLYCNIPINSRSEIDIYNQYGVLINNFTIDNNYLDISQLSKGLYYIMVNNNSTSFIKL